jgi:hypothetical protein
MFATIYVPNFYLQAALRHQPERAEAPVALIDGEATKAVIIQLNAAAARVGVTVGMTPSQGLARYLPLLVRTRSRAQEKLLSAMLLQFAFALAPYVEATAPGIATVQFTDSRNLTVKVERVVTLLAASEITARAGIADTPDASLLAAHLANPVLQVNDTRDFLRPLPIETLAQV